MCMSRWCDQAEPPWGLLRNDLVQALPRVRHVIEVDRRARSPHQCPETRPGVRECRRRGRVIAQRLHSVCEEGHIECRPCPPRTPGGCAAPCRTARWLCTRLCRGHAPRVAHRKTRLVSAPPMRSNEKSAGVRTCSHPGSRRRDFARRGRSMGALRTGGTKMRAGQAVAGASFSCAGGEVSSRPRHEPPLRSRLWICAV